MNKCIYFDRDGIINVSPGPGYVERAEDFHLVEAFVDALRVVKDRGYLAIVVTNQRGIGRGIMTQEAVDEIHDKMNGQLAERGVAIDELYLCPHNHNECDCRKPLPGMLLKAAEKHDIDLSQSWMVGDNETDIQAGRSAGCRTVMVGTEYKGISEADYRFETMDQLVQFLQDTL